jgi:ferredoxin
MDKPQILLDRCVRGSSRWVECRTCERSCPKGAITLGEKPFQLSVSESCDGCGLCWTQCPAEAVLPPLAERLLGREELWVLCQRTNTERAETPEQIGLRVPCVREMGFRFFAVEWMAGLRRLIVCGADCSGCDVVLPVNHEDGLQRVNEILRVAGQGPIEVLSAESLGESEGWVGVKERDDVEPATSRRELFKAAIAGTLDAAFPTSLELPGKEPEADRPVAFLEALRRLSIARESETKGRLAAYRLSVDPRGCYGCRVCATLCPTGALAWEEDPEPPGSARMRIDPSRCHGCGACRDLCDAGAIEVTFRPDFHVQEEVLFKERRCAECDRIFLSVHPAEDLCPGCRMRDRYRSCAEGVG